MARGSIPSALASSTAALSRAATGWSSTINTQPGWACRGNLLWQGCHPRALPVSFLPKFQGFLKEEEFNEIGIFHKNLEFFSQTVVSSSQIKFAIKVEISPKGCLLLLRCSAVQQLAKGDQNGQWWPKWTSAKPFKSFIAFLAHFGMRFSRF